MQSDLGANELRTMLFGLRMKLPFLYEQREELDGKIKGVESDIRGLLLRLNGDGAAEDATDVLVVKNRRGRPPRALIEAAAQNGQVEKPKRRLSVAGLKAIQEAQARRRERERVETGGMPAAQREKLRAGAVKRWANYSARQRKAEVAKLAAARAAAREARQNA